ncbi:MAG: hypothetical protein IIZ94_11995 [Prevotella sp.]|nr:hypothetical protein [Prevotella sp.]
MTPVAILNKEATNFKSPMDMLRMRTEILNTPELERDWEAIYRRFANKPEDIKLIQTKAEGGEVIKIYSVSDRVLDAMYTLGEEDNKVTKSALWWAINKVANGEGEFTDDQSNKKAVVFWVQSVAMAMVRKINPHFIGYVSHCDEDEVVNRICEIIAFHDNNQMKRPSCQQILKDWIEGDWAPIYMVAED